MVAAGSDERSLQSLRQEEGTAWTRVAAGGCRIWDASGDRGLTDGLGRGRKEPGTTPGLGVGVSG